MVKYIRQSSLIRACQRPVRSSYFFARKEGWRRPRSRFVSCLPKAFWTSGGLAIRLAANGSASPLERSAGTPHAPGVRWPLVTASRIPPDVGWADPERDVAAALL